MIIIGLGNKARQGKDVAANAIVDYYAQRSFSFFKHGVTNFRQIKAQRIGFADALYKIAREVHGMTEKDAPLLQRIGEARRAQDPEYWIKKAFASIKPDTDIAVISDMRYKNEADYITAKGGFTVNITRRMQNGGQLIATDRPVDHPSEIDLDGYPFDFYLINSDGHQALLAEQAVCLTEYLRALETK